MAKKTGKKSANKGSKSRKRSSAKIAVADKNKTEQQTAQHVIEAPKEQNRFQFSEKIRLEPSNHSYGSAFHRRYDKHLVKVKGPAYSVFKFLTVMLAMFALSVATLFLVFGRDLPDVSKLKEMNFSETTRIYDREGNVLYSIYSEENRKYVPLAYINPLAVDATIAIEDKSFYSHLGFDVFGMLRAQIKNVQDESISQGGSTITQQLAKNIFLSSERTYERKIKELLLSLEIEWLYSKDEIIEMYLNKIAYGSNSYGIEAASQTYFGKSSKELDLAESAVLASLPKAPSYFSPYGQNKKELMGYCKADEEQKQNPEEAEPQELLALSTQELMEETAMDQPVEAIPAETQETQTQELIAEVPSKCASMDDEGYYWGRKDYVLERMIEDHYITKAQAEDAWKVGLTLKFKDPVHKIEAPHFVFYVKELLEQKYGKELVENGGLEVKTTLDPKLQSVAEESIARQAPHNLKYYSANNGGLVSLDPRTGQILAMVGSVDYWDTNINGQVNVTTSFRQPGSSFKPLVYAAAIQNAGIGSGTILSDEKTVFNHKDVPRNSDNDYKGKMKVRDALAQSRNIPAIKAYYLAGEEEKLLDFLDKVGLSSLRQFKTDFNKDAEKRGWTFNYGWPMAIGSGEVRLLDLASAYGALANGGKYVAVNPILEVRDRKGNVLEKFDPSQIKAEQVIDPQAAYIVSSILSDASAKPAGTWRSSMTIPDHTVASKTGTSNKKVGAGIYPNNNILMGYTPSLVTGVWIGNTDGKQMRGNAWAFLDAGPVWKDFFAAALEGKPDEKFPEPEGIKWIGREVYPSFADFRSNFDTRFKKVDTQETIEVPESTLVADEPTLGGPPTLPIQSEAPQPDTGW